MSRKRFLGIIGIIALLSGLAVFVKAFFFSTTGPVFGALQVDSIPKAETFLDGKSVGQTPFSQDKLKPGEYNLKVGSWESKVQINAGTLTYVSRELLSPEEKSAGQVLTLEKLPTDHTSELSVVSDPDSASVIIDGLENDKTPIILKNITAGDHTIVVSFPGYSDQVIQGRLISGFRLNATIKLRKLDVITPVAIPAAAPVASASAQVEIQITPVGYLRVRAKPDINALEIGKVYPKEKYDIVSQNTDWVQIKFGKLTGWVAKDYVNITP